METAKNDFIECAKQGILRHAVPKEEGGYGDSFHNLCQAYEKIGLETQNTGLILSLQAHVWGTIFPLLQFGTPAQKERSLPSLLEGRLIGGHAITEPAGGSHIASIQTTYQKVEHGYLLNGHKRFITNTPIADLLIVYAQMGGSLSSFIVRRENAQFLNGPKVEGFASAPMGDLLLNDCFVPETDRIGPEGAGGSMIQSVLELERAFLFAGIAGVMQWQLDTVIKCCRQRKKQSISHKIADMAARLATTRLWIAHCAQLKDNRKRISLASSQAKLYASEAFLQSSLDAIHILGASGLIKEQKMVQLVQDAMAGKLASGSSEIQKNIIAGLLGIGANNCC